MTQAALWTSADDPNARFMLLVYPFGTRTGMGSELAAPHMNRASAPALNGLHSLLARTSNPWEGEKRKGRLRKRVREINAATSNRAPFPRAFETPAD